MFSCACESLGMRVVEKGSSPQGNSQLYRCYYGYSMCELHIEYLDLISFSSSKYNMVA